VILERDNTRPAQSSSSNGGGQSGGVKGPLATAEHYDPSTESWTPTGSMDGVRAVHTATMLPDGTVLVTGGISGNHIYSLGLLASAELYDPTTQSWTRSPSMAEVRGGTPPRSCYMGTVLVAGGSGAGLSGALAPAELFDPDSQN
jgi:hypothetical protein